MGTFSSPVRISSLDGRNTVEIEATVDTGAAYSMLPGNLLDELGIEPAYTSTFEFADGRRVDMSIGRAWATIDGQSEITLVIFGENEVPPLLGAYTLEGLRLAVDPVNQKLVPATPILY